MLAELLLAVPVLLAAAAVTLPAAERMAVLQVELVAVQQKAKLSVNASGGEGVMSGIGDGDSCNGSKCGGVLEKGDRRGVLSPSESFREAPLWIAVSGFAR